ncbi:MAG: Hpt domain-containing protein [Isosphaeraceae bacterium]
MDAYVAKPLRPEELDDVLDRLFPAPADGDAQVDNDRTATMAARTPERFDLGAALDHLGGDAALLKELAGLFLGECPGRMADIRRAIDEHDGPALERTAHYIKGSVGHFVASEAFDAAARLERSGRVEDWSRVERDWSTLEGAIGAMVPGLTALVQAPTQEPAAAPGAQASAVAGTEGAES